MEIQIHNKSNHIYKHNISIEKITVWVCIELNLPIKKLDIIFIDDERMRAMHKQYLNEDTYTDVMTFNLGSQDSIEGEIYISSDRAEENARFYKVSVINEIFRLLIHGCLHLHGYEDKDEENRKLMQAKEEELLTQAVMKYIK